jgi:carbonic anhydrase/acetyltransferase-like protein (isoleucine patch superfamily)
MALIKSVRGFNPVIPDNCFLADNATIIGDVIIGDDCSIWFNAVVRGDVNSIRLGDRVNIQDGAVIHATLDKSKSILGNDVSVGHNAIIHGCTIHDEVLVGMGSIIMDLTVVESHVLVAAGALSSKIHGLSRAGFMEACPPRKLSGLMKRRCSFILRGRRRIMLGMENGLSEICPDFHRGWLFFPQHPDAE